MLYKKIHRQHVREWRLGRKFKFSRGSSAIYRVSREPYIAYIEGISIWVEDIRDDIRDDSDERIHIPIAFCLFDIADKESGQLLQAHKITWLED